METMLDAALGYARRGWAVHALEARSKEPATKHGFKDATTRQGAIERLWGDYPDLNVSIATGSVSGGLLVIDLDVDEEKGKDGVEWLSEWEAENGKLPETACTVTGRGGQHLYYMTDRRIGCSVNGSIGVDVRCDGGYVMAPPSVHPNGNVVYWDLSPEDVGVAQANDTVYKLIDEIAPSSDDDTPFEPLSGTMVEGDGRDDHLYKFCCSHRARSVLKSDCMEFAKSYNRAHFLPPLPMRDIIRIVNSAYSKPEGLSNEAKSRAAAKKSGPGRPRKFEHNKVARRLMDELGACRIDGVPAIRVGGVYQTGWDAIDSAIYELHDDATTGNLREVRHYLQVRSPRLSQSEPTLIGFKNGVLDVESMEFRDYTASDVIPNVIPHEWDGDATSPLVDRFLEDVSCGDVSVMLNLAETIGLCMFRDATWLAYCPVLLGGGSNGKSTYINFLRYVIGEDNISSMQPNEISRRFQAANIVGKTANLGDDISGGYLDDDACGTIKKIATGDTIYTDVKGGTGFDFKPYCTMVFSANTFPRLADTTDGMMRRLFPIEFNAKFVRGSEGFDPQIGRRLQTEEAAQAALAIGVEALRRMLQTGEMTETEASQRIKSGIVADNNTVLQWLNDMPRGGSELEGWTRDYAYEMYAEWADKNGYTRTKATSRRMVAQIGTFAGLFLDGFCHIDGENARETRRVFVKRAN